MDEILFHRSKFPIFENKIQLSSCSQSALHVDVKNSIKQYMNSWEDEGMDWELWMSVCERARNRFAELINAKPHEIAIVSSVSHAISSVVTSLPIGNGKKEILVANNDFPCIGHAALSQSDFDVCFTDNDLESYIAAVNGKTILTSIPHVSYYNGAIADVEEITRIAKQKNSYVFVDAYQSAGQVEIDVKAMDIDFLTAGMQKYLLGIPGIAFLYVKEEIAEELTPKITGWFGQKNPFAFDVQKVEYAKAAIKFDTGTFPMINGFAADKALEIILKTGVRKIQSYLQELSKHTIEYCSKHHLEIASPLEVNKKGSNTAIKVPNASLLEKELKKEGFLVSARNDVIRIAPHYYNTKQDIEEVINSIVRLLSIK